MKQLKRRIFTLILSMSLFLFSGMTVFASGEGNIDGGGGGMGSGTATDVWHGQDGVRVTVVTTDGSVASTPFDMSNANVANNVLNFGKVCKLQYSSGASLSPNGSYSYSKPGVALPRIISGTSSRASIEAIRRYFCSEYAAQLVSAKSGIPFEELVSGSYKLVIEPIAYFTHGGRNYAMTATEAALYNQKSGGTLRSRMPSLTHQNLPLSIFLETPDLGYPAWSGTTSGKVSDADILSALGIGIVSYRDVPEAELQAPDYTYQVDTDVITSITLTSSAEVNPDDPASVTFHINGGTYTVNDIVMPAGGSQVVWAKWHTPLEPTTLTIQVPWTAPPPQRPVLSPGSSPLKRTCRLIRWQRTATHTFPRPPCRPTRRRTPHPGASGAPNGTRTGNGRATGTGKTAATAPTAPPTAQAATDTG